MRLGSREARAAVSLFSARSWVARIGALLVILSAVLTLCRGESTPHGAASNALASGSYQGEVVGVSDGDTLKVLDAERQQHKVRLAFIDAPEKSQPYGMAAKKALSDKVYRQVVQVEVQDKDRYGREVARIWLGDTDINAAQLAEGWAWHYRQYAKKGQSAADYARDEAAEQQARDERRGLWAGDDPEPPWDYRRAKREANAE